MHVTTIYISHGKETLMSTVTTWPAQAENWLDQRGKPAWIAAMVLGFIVFWPIGLALLAYMLWSKRLGGECGRRHRARGFRSTGNSAFDAYKAETLRRLQEEQDSFEQFLKRLRDAKDKAEFDQFMDERARKARTTDMPGDDGAPA
jgi:hypothetical protein